MTKEELTIEVIRLKDVLPIQTYRALLGQIKAGDLIGAEIGLLRLKRKRARKEAPDAHRNR